MLCCHSIQDQLVCTLIISYLLNIIDYQSMNQIFIKRMISPNPFFYNKSSKYCYGSECDLMNDVNSSNSSNLRNTVLSVNCRLYIAAKFLLVCDPIFFMNKYDTLKNWWVPIQLTFNQNSMYQVRLSRGIVCFKILISEGKKTICHYEIKIRDNN